MYKTLLKRKTDIGFKKINIRGDEITIIFLSLIFLIFLVFSSLRFLAIGKLFDDFIFSFLFGWTKYLVYTLMLILIVPVFFNHYFKIKFKFLFVIIISLLTISWLVQNVFIIINNDKNIWLNRYYFHFASIKRYVTEWWNNSIINNYHGFFAQPISFSSWDLAGVFPEYAAGGIVSNFLVGLLSYPFLLSFSISIIIALIIFPWLLFVRPFLFFMPFFTMGVVIKNYFKNHKNSKNHQRNSELHLLSKTDKDSNINCKNNKKVKINSIATENNMVTEMIKQQAATRNNLTSSIINSVENQAEVKTVISEAINPEVLMSMNSKEIKYHKESSKLTPFGYSNSSDKIKENQEKIVNIIEEHANTQSINSHNEMLNNDSDIKILDFSDVKRSNNTNYNKNYILPKLTPINSQTSQDKQLKNERYALENKNKINQLFNEFAIQGKVENYHIGTTVTKYEIATVSGMRVSKITSLEDELKLTLANNNIRIEAPIPGKSLIGIEVANKYIVPVNLAEQIRNLDQAKNENRNLLISIGKTTTGQYLFHSLQDMPHLLIAGSTGAGKSVFINDLIISILLQYEPHEVKLLLIDPKWVELTIYNDIAHLLAPIITEPDLVAPALKVVIQEMMRRYKLFSQNTCRNIESYNKKNIDKARKLPYYLIVIDELADLMIQNGKEVEEGIMRITQMGRAAGIHLVVATQRPSIDVITGVIKNNIPSRIAFQVASFVDSRTIIDMSGAEKLLGKGDMLFLTPGNNGPIRVQAPWISEEEVLSVIEFIKNQIPVEYDDNFLNLTKSSNFKKKT